VRGWFDGIAGDTGGSVVKEGVHACEEYPVRRAGCGEWAGLVVFIG